MSPESRAPDLPTAAPAPAAGNGHDPLGDLFAPPPERGPAPEIVKRKPKLKKLRLLLVLLGVGALALISTIFGMMISVAGELPDLENHAQLRIAKNSVLYSGAGKNEQIASLTGAQNRVLDESGEISPNVKNAVIAIEDKRFYEHQGVDFRGIARAVVSDVFSGRAAQGASTIEQQFVKNVLAEQRKRTVFEKLREAALAYHLDRKWSKDKILTEYLNTIYFGNGAYGIEAAARTYFGGGERPYDPTAPKAAANLAPWQAAYLAGMIASPSAYDPVQHPVASHGRMNLVLLRMLQQGYITRQQYQSERDLYVNPKSVHPPMPDSKVPYFSSWVTQQLLDRYRSTGLVFGGGLHIKTTIDMDVQNAAVQAIQGRLAGVGPSASLVAIDNKTGEVRAMVGGPDFETHPFNLATNGHRQPGSAFKPFTLIGALEKGISPDKTFVSAPRCFKVPHSPREHFCPHNYENHYAGISTVTNGTINSDNSVYAQLGLDYVGTNKIARVAHEMGVRTPLSRNPAMVLGGLHEGVTPLEMAYAYSTLANDGVRVSGTLSPSSRSPDAIEAVREPGGHIRDQNHVRRQRVIPFGVAEQAKSILAKVIQMGTGTAAQIGEFAAGKTGTTENYGDAWFVGFNKDLTVAVWVGYPDRLKPMLTEFRGGPVAGGTYPAQIWHDFMTAWINIRDTRAAAHGKKAQTGVTTTGPAPVTSTQTSTVQAQTAPQTTQQGATQAPATAPPTQKTPSKQQTQPTDGQQPPDQTQQQPTQGTGDGTSGTGTGGGTGTGTGAGTAPPGATGQQQPGTG